MAINLHMIGTVKYRGNNFLVLENCSSKYSNTLAGPQIVYLLAGGEDSEPCVGKEIICNPTEQRCSMCGNKGKELHNIWKADSWLYKEDYVKTKP